MLNTVSHILWRLYNLPGFLDSSEGNQCCVPGTSCEQEQTRPSRGNQRWLSRLHCVADRFDLLIVIRKPFAQGGLRGLCFKFTSFSKGLSMGPNWHYKVLVRILITPSRAVRCRKNYNWFCSGGVPSFSWHSMLFSWWWQHSSWPEQESGFHHSRQRREHPPYCRGGQAVCWCRLGLHH